MTGSHGRGGIPGNPGVQKKKHNSKGERVNSQEWDKPVNNGGGASGPMPQAPGPEQGLWAPSPLVHGDVGLTNPDPRHADAPQATPQAARGHRP